MVPVTARMVFVFVEMGKSSCLNKRLIKRIYDEIYY